MTDFDDLNLKLPLIETIAAFMNSSISCSAELSMKKVL